MQLLLRFWHWLQDPMGVNEIVNRINMRASMLQGEILHTHKRSLELLTAFSDFEKRFEEHKFYLAVEKALDASLPDLLWAKDIHGRYVIANKTIRETLLFDDSPYGKTDVTLAKARKAVVGDRNHTFGEMCGNSDKIVLATETPTLFLESGLITGKEVFLKVHKAVLKDRLGNVIGTVGTGRNVTEEYNTLKDILDTTTCSNTRDKLAYMIEKHRFWGE